MDMSLIIQTEGFVMLIWNVSLPMKCVISIWIKNVLKWRNRRSTGQKWKRKLDSHIDWNILSCESRSGDHISSIQIMMNDREMMKQHCGWEISIINITVSFWDNKTIQQEWNQYCDHVKNWSLDESDPWIIADKIIVHVRQNHQVDRCLGKTFKHILLHRQTAFENDP
jgi:hypothetical protein